MARRRVKSCEYCEDNTTTDYISHRNGFCLWVEFYPFNQVMTPIAQANDEEGDMIEDYLEIPMNFCPNCGRDLRNEEQ